MLQFAYTRINQGCSVIGVDGAKENSDSCPVGVQAKIGRKFFFIDKPLLLIIVVLAQKQGALGTQRWTNSEEEEARNQEESKPMHKRNIIRYK
jgi:hypothetical protein